jgi:hypothetical protein
VWKNRLTEAGFGIGEGWHSTAKSSDGPERCHCVKKKKGLGLGVGVKHNKGSLSLLPFVKERLYFIFCL